MKINSWDVIENYDDISQKCCVCGNVNVVQKMESKERCLWKDGVFSVYRLGRCELHKCTEEDIKNKYFCYIRESVINIK